VAAALSLASDATQASEGAHLPDTEARGSLPTDRQAEKVLGVEGRLALLELRDERIARVVNYGSTPAGAACSAISASTERSVSSLTGLTK
jgi:sensor domain CHASE-containing protein